MRKIIYLIEFILIKILFIIFKLIGYKFSSNLGFLIGVIFGPLFKSKKQIINNSNTHLIVTKKKFTISKKRNIGVSYAKTKYIGFIDSDA